MIQCIADVSITIEKEPVKSNGTTVPMHELARNVHVESFSSESIEKAEKIILDLFAGEIDGRLLARGIFAPFLKSQ